MLLFLVIGGVLAIALLLSVLAFGIHEFGGIFDPEEAPVVGAQRQDIRRGLLPWVATVTPYTMKSNSQFRVDPPPDLTSEEFAADYNELNPFNRVHEVWE
jgi:hypothetical protein